MKKIVIVTAAMVAGGAQRVISQLINEWIKKENVEITLILTEKMKMFYAVPTCVNVIEIGRTETNPLKDKVKRYGEIRRIIQKGKPDIILSFPEEIGIYVALSNIGTGVPIVVSERNNPWVMPNVKITRLLRKISYHFVDGLIFQTERAKSFFPKIIQKKGIVLANPLELNRIPDPFFGEREKIIVSAGRLELQKNFALLIDAFSDFSAKHTDYKMVIYGEGTERDNLQKKINELGLHDRVELPGTNNNLLAMINKASLFVLSSDYEGVPNVLIEAMAMGLPVVSTDCEPGGAASLIKNQYNGLIVPIRDKEKLSDAISYMIDYREEAISMSYNAINVREMYDSETVCKQWYNYLLELIKN